MEQQKSEEYTIDTMNQSEKHNNIFERAHHDYCQSNMIYKQVLPKSKQQVLVANEQHNTSKTQCEEDSMEPCSYTHCTATPLNQLINTTIHNLDNFINYAHLVLDAALYDSSCLDNPQIIEDISLNKQSIISLMKGATTCGKHIPCDIPLPNQQFSQSMNTYHALLSNQYEQIIKQNISLHPNASNHRPIGTYNNTHQSNGQSNSHLVFCLEEVNKKLLSMVQLVQEAHIPMHR